MKCLCAIGLLAFAGGVFAVDRSWLPTGNSSNDFAVGSNWTTGSNPGNNDRGFITNNSASANQTNIAYRSGNYQMFGAADVGIIVSNSNTAGQGINKFLLNSGHFEMQGMVIGNNGIVEVLSGAMLSAYSQATLSSGGTLAIHSGTVRLNGENVGTFTINGTVLVNSGTLDGSPFAANNVSIIVGSGGRFIANSGTVYVNTDNAYANGGFRIASGGTLDINSGATFLVDRDGGAWNDARANIFGAAFPTNSGVININGGTLTVMFNGSQASDREIVNNGTIIVNANGILAARIMQTASGNLIATNGTMLLFTNIAGNVITITNNFSGDFGTIRAVTSGRILIGQSGIPSGVGGSWNVDNGGTLEIVAGANADLRAAFMPGSQLQGTVHVNSGANLTLASTNAGGPTLLQSGTFLFHGGSILMPNVTGLNVFTNVGQFVLGSGNGTFQTGFGAGQNNYGFVNTGTIVAGGGGSLTFRPDDAFFRAFSNAAAGTIIVSNGSHLTIQRTASAWGAGTTNVVNFGNIILNSGTVVTRDATDHAGTQTIQSHGTITVVAGSTNFWRSTLHNFGRVALTNGGALTQTGSLLVNFNGGVISNVNGTFTVIGTATNAGYIVLNNGAFLVQGGTHFLAGGGSITGSGTLGGTLVVQAGSTLSAVGGTLAVTNNGAFSSAGNLDIVSGGTLLLTNTADGTGLTFSNAGNILMRGGTLLAGFVTNAGLIAGTGTIDGAGVFNGGTLLASNLTANVGTFTVRLTSFTNAAAATIGTIGTQAVLNVRTPGGVNVLINEGTINISGGTIVFNDGGAGTVTNFNVVGGVGNLASFPVVNVGNASLIAQNPIPGLSNLIASVGITNSGLLAARQGTTLELSVSAGNTIVNTNRVWLEGSSIVLQGGTGILTNVNNGLVVGWGTLQAAVANLAGGTVRATNGVLTLGVLNNTQGGTFSNLDASAAIRLTNSILVNTGNIFLSGGGLYLTGSTITNQGTMTGPGDSPSALYNDTTGWVIATNGTFHIATNANEFVQNAGTFLIVNGGTLNIGPAVWNNLAGGLITNDGGGVITRAAGVGLVTNAGVIVNAGTFDLRLHNTGNVTNAGGRFTHSVTNAAGGVIISSGGTFSGTVFANIGGTVIATNAAVNILNPVVLNTGTIVGSPAARVIMTNMTDNLSNAGTLILNGAGTGDAAESFFILRTAGGSADFTNAPGGVIQGAGYFKTATFVPGDRNFAIRNLGQILATNGMMILQPGDAFAGGGFANLGGTVTVANASALAIQRSDNAWANSGTVPHNEGLLLLNGGTLIFYGDSLAVANDRALSNAVGGTIRGFGTLITSLSNQGTVIATNGNLVLNNAAATTQDGTLTIANGATFTVLGSAGSFHNNGRMLMGGGTFVGTNFTLFVNAGTISGRGTISTGRNSGSGGANVNQVNTGLIIANSGTLYLDPGDAFAGGGFSNAASGWIVVSNGATLTLNRTANAWNNIGVAGNTNPRNLGTIELAGGEFILRSSGGSALGRFVDNLGTITGNGFFTGSLTNFGTIAATNGTLQANGTGAFRQAGTLIVSTTGVLTLTNITAGTGWSFTNEGNILMRGGELQAGVIGNTNVIFGWGTIAGGGVNNFGRLLASNGVLNAALLSFTNLATATLGTLSTNATLDVQLPGGVAQPLINLGTVNMAGGTLLLSGSGSGTISNRPTGVIVGVGEVTQTIYNDGTILAANPVSGLSIFSVGLGEFNNATIGASNNATLNVIISGGALSSFNNPGSISMIGGTLIISNGAPGVISNSFMVSGVGTVTPAIHNTGTIAATVNNGVLDVRLLGGTNTTAGRLLAGLGATLQFQGTVENFGTIGPDGANGGVVQMASATGVLTNRGIIMGTAGLTFNSFVHNATDGLIRATNGTVVFAAINGLLNAGTINVANDGTFQSNSSNGWANAGTIDLRGGTLRTGGFTNTVTAAIFTNSGNINGFGTILGGGAYGGSGVGFDKSFVNTGTIVATNPLSSAARTLTISTGGATELDGLRNVGTMIISSNNTLSLNRNAGLPIFNLGTITIHNGTLTGSGVLSNDAGGIIEGYGTLSHPIVNASGGTIRATNGLMTMTSLIHPINFGTLQIWQGATMTWNVSNAWQNSGTIDLRGGTLRTGGQTNALLGESFTNQSYIVGFGTLIGGGAFNTNGAGFDKAVLNYGYVIASNGLLTIDTGVATTNRGLANYGTMIVAGPTDTLSLFRRAEITGPPLYVTNMNFLYNSGRIFVRGGTLTSNTAMTNQFENVSLPGLIQGWGTFTFTNELVNLGTIRSTNGIFRIYNFQPGDPAGINLRQFGTLAVEAGSEMILGVQSNAFLGNAGTIVMRGGTLRSGPLTNQFGATFAGFGTIVAPTIINSGTGMATSLSQVLRLASDSLINRTNGVLGANYGRLEVDGIFTNAGTVTFLHSVGTFHSKVVNQGAWLMDPSTNVFYGDYSVATNGYITMTAGDVSIFKSNFFNSSLLNTNYNTLPGTFVFDGVGGHTQIFGVAGVNLGGFNSDLQPSNEVFFTLGSGTFSTNSFYFYHGSPFGYSNNFALGTLEVGGLNTTSTLILVDTWGLFEPSDGKVAGLYLDTLTIHPGSLLIISNNVQLFFRHTNGVNSLAFGTWDGVSSVLLLDGASFHQINIIPEPSVLMLLVLGGVGIYWRRRRRAA